jgi:hypothetical protein
MKKMDLTMIIHLIRRKRRRRMMMKMEEEDLQFFRTRIKYPRQL